MFSAQQHQRIHAWSFAAITFVIVLCFAEGGIVLGQNPVDKDPESGTAEDQPAEKRQPANNDGKRKAGPRKKIVLLTNGDDPYWDVVFAGAKQAAKDLKLSDAALDVVTDNNSEFRGEKQLEKLEQYGRQDDVAAIVISPVDANNKRIADELRSLRKQGVAVLCMDADMNREKFRDTRFAYFGTNNVAAGELLGKAARGLLPEGGKYATFVGLKTVANSVERHAGFAKGAGEKFELVDTKTDEGDLSRANENVRDVLLTEPDAKLLVGIWAYNAHAIVRGVEKQRARAKKKIVAFDAAQQALDDLAKGKIDALVVQNPYQIGELAVTLSKALIEKDGAAIKQVLPDYDPVKGEFTKRDGDLGDTELRIVVPDKGSPLSQETFGTDAKFFRSTEFQKWLDERKIKNS